MAVCILVLATSVAEATLVSVQQEVDLAIAVGSGGAPNVLYQQFNHSPLIKVEMGDTVNLTFNFVNGRLRMKNSSVIPSELDYVLPLLVFPGLGGSAFGISDIQISFLDAVASGGAETYFSISSQSQLNSTTSLGPALVDFLPSGAALTFSGIQTSYTVDFLYGTQDYYTPFLQITADELTVASIPEPTAPVFGTLVLLVLGGRSLGRRR